MLCLINLFLFILNTKNISWYDNEQSHGDVSVMLELWRLRSTSSLLSPPSPLWPGAVATDRVLSMDQIEQNAAKKKGDTKLNCLK